MSAFFMQSLRLFLAIYLFYSALVTFSDKDYIFERNTSQAIGYYYDRFAGVRNFQKNHPIIFSEIDSMIGKGVSLLSLTAGMFVLTGSKFFGGLLSITHALTMILFNSNLWTPKVSVAENELTQLLIALVELGAGFFYMFKITPPEIPIVKEKS